MESKPTEHLSAFLQTSFWALLSSVGAVRLLSVSTSDEWRMVGMILVGLAAILALAALISLLGLVATLIAAGIVKGSSRALNLFRFYAARKAVAIATGLCVAVAGSSAVSTYDSRLMVVPFAIGIAIAFLPNVWATLIEQPLFYRIFRSGNAPEAEFAQRYHLKKIAKPFRSTFRSRGGYCADELFVGTSTKETT